MDQPSSPSIRGCKKRTCESSPATLIASDCSELAGSPPSSPLRKRVASETSSPTEYIGEVRPAEHKASGPKESSMTATGSENKSLQGEIRRLAEPSVCAAVEIKGVSDENTAKDHLSTASTVQNDNPGTFEVCQQANRTVKKDPSLPVVPPEVAASIGKGERKLKMAPRHLPLRNVFPNRASNNSYLQVYGTGFDTGDTVSTVLLFFDQRRFIFNAGEGLQRFCTEHKFKLSRIDHIFLTRVCSETTGGLPGLLLTLAGIGETGMAVQIWGPANLQKLVNAMRSFVPNASIVHAHSFGCQAGSDSTPIYSSTPVLVLEDELVTISAVFLEPHRKRILTVHDERTRAEASLNLEQPDIGMDQAEPKNDLCTDLSVVYICELSEVVGKFDPKKALAKGLKPGSKYGKLQRGESVISDDGSQMVHPKDVLDPSRPGPIMILVDCPSISHIPALTSAASLQSYFSGSGKVVNCVVHISPASVTNCSEYQDWIANFKEAHHLMAQREQKELGVPILESSARIQCKLNFICPKLFPITGFHSERLQKPTGQKTISAPGRGIVADNLVKFRFRPLEALGVDISSVPLGFNLITAQEEFIRECPEALKAQEYISQVWKAVEVPRMIDRGLDAFEGLEYVPECVQHASREEMEFIFLGTGSSQPSKYRNVSAIYVHFFERGGILLDCGEGTYAQLIRRYGAEGANAVLLSLKCIWISHIHADHHTGLPRLLSARRRLYQDQSTHDPILVVGPIQLKRFLDAYRKVENLDMVFLECSQTTSETNLAKGIKEHEIKEARTGEIKDGAGLSGFQPFGKPSEDITRVKGQIQNFSRQHEFHSHQDEDAAGSKALQRVMRSTGLKTLVSVPVVHCLNAFGVVLESHEKLDHRGDMQPGWKLVYSGDTRPCQALLDASKGATVLIHEATFDDSMPMEAIMKNHSITKDAIDIGVSAGVYRIILTHFSQRYPKIPVFNESYADRTCIAFDMMSVNLADLPLLPKLLPALKMVFKDDLTVEDDTNVAL